MNWTTPSLLGPLLATCVAVAACGGAADREARDDDRPAAGTDAAEPGAQEVRLTGCIERGAIPGTYVLTRADGDGTAPVGTSGTDAVAAATRYTITSRAGDLSQHVGQRVTVAGHWLDTAERENLGTREGARVGGDDAGAARERGEGSRTAEAAATRGLDRQLQAHSVETAGRCE